MRLKHVMIAGLVLVALALLFLNLDRQRIREWFLLQRSLAEHSSVVPEFIVNPAALVPKESHPWYWNEAGIAFRLPWPVQRVDSERPMRIETQRGVAVLLLAGGEIPPASTLPWCDLITTPSGREELLRQSERSVLDLVRGGDSNVLAATDRLDVLYFVYHQTPDVSLWRSLQLTDSEWNTYYLSTIRKAQFDLFIERGVSIFASDQHLVVVRLGTEQHGNTLDALVFSCNGNLLFTVIANGTPEDENSVDFILGLLSDIEWHADD